MFYFIICLIIQVTIQVSLVIFCYVLSVDLPVFLAMVQEKAFLINASLGVAFCSHLHDSKG